MRRKIGYCPPRLRLSLPHVLLRIACAVALLLSGAACSKPSTQSVPTTDSPTAASDGVDAPERPSPSDESLTVQEYVELGLPAHDREWSGEDMATAAKVLTSLAPAKFGQLPRHKSEKSGEMFARMTSPQNLELFKNQTLPIEVRLQQSLVYYQAYNEVNKLYLQAYLQQDVRDSEIVELMGGALRSTVVILALVEEFLPTISKDDPSYEVRMQGLERMKRGLASVVTGNLHTLTDKNARTSELLRLLGYMQETFPQLVPQLPPSSRSEAMLRMEQMNKDSTLQRLQPGFNDLYLKVKSSIEDEVE